MLALQSFRLCSRRLHGIVSPGLAAIIKCKRRSLLSAAGKLAQYALGSPT